MVLTIVHQKILQILKKVVIGEEPTNDTNDINISVGEPERKFNNNFTKRRTKICHYNGIESYLYMNRAEIWKLRVFFIVFSLIFKIKIQFLITLNQNTGK